ncbi:MAG: O-succinylbenzoic acid--CoA ligase [Muricauda sp.]|nr:MULTISPECIES: AMP-binding protein [unclassified Allomuricauda]MAU15774.1 O-succinylbenzoic acid--CoA ligase [Allomuricauda sp.]|tara:strand:- start:626 stop:1702 length:1077 start_codon:yes stop_codon:yes gene_type:complete
MEHPTWHNVHPDFSLNGIPSAFENLFEIGYSLIKEGEPFEKPIGDFLVDWASKKPTLEVATSGSTGKPKTIVLQKEHMVNSALATGEFFQLKPNQKALLCLPCTGIAGKMMLVRAMVLGLQLDYVEPSSSPLPENNKVYDFVAMVPLQVQNSLSQLSTRVKTLIVGGAPVEAGLRSKLKTLSTQTFETYGMTETITHVALKRIDRESSGYFEALPNVSIAQDERGCLVIDAPKISNERIVTNDMVELAGNTQFEWMGRYDSIINSGGIKLVPESIEEKLSNLIKSRFFVAGMPDETLGQKLVLVVEGNATEVQKLLQSIKNIKTLSKYEVPKEVYFVNSFVETVTKKIDRRKTIQQIN